MYIECLANSGISFRTALRGLKRGKSLLVECGDRRGVNSRRTNAYDLARREGRKYKCVTGEGWRLLITRTE